MQWTNTRTMVIGLLSLLLVTPSFAQRGAENAAVFRASTVIGANVDNRQGEDLGNIEDVIIDSQTGHVAYAVLASGGFLGLGEKHFVIPWSALTPQAGTLTAREQFILHIDKERLANAPSFERNNWPMLPQTATAGCTRHKETMFQSASAVCPGMHHPECTSQLPRASVATADRCMLDLHADRPSRSQEPEGGMLQMPGVLLQTLLAEEAPRSQVELQVPKALLTILSIEGL